MASEIVVKDGKVLHLGCNVDTISPIISKPVDA